MTRSLKIFLGIFLAFLFLCLFVFYRYNLTFGESVFQKSVMAGCMNRALNHNSFSESRSYCECTWDHLFLKYSDDEIRYNNLEVRTKEAEVIKSCVGDLEDIRWKIKLRTTTYKHKALINLESTLLARLQRLIVLRKINFAISHCFCTGRYWTFGST